MDLAIARRRPSLSLLASRSKLCRAKKKLIRGCEPSLSFPSLTHLISNLVTPSTMVAGSSEARGFTFNGLPPSPLLAFFLWDQGKVIGWVVYDFVSYFGRFGPPPTPVTRGQRRNIRVPLPSEKIQGLTEKKKKKKFLGLGEINLRVCCAVLCCIMSYHVRCRRRLQGETCVSTDPDGGVLFVF